MPTSTDTEVLDVLAVLDAEVCWRSASDFGRRFPYLDGAYQVEPRE